MMNSDVRLTAMLVALLASFVALALGYRQEFNVLILAFCTLSLIPPEGKTFTNNFKFNLPMAFMLSGVSLNALAIRFDVVWLSVASLVFTFVSFVLLVLHVIRGEPLIK